MRGAKHAGGARPNHYDIKLFHLSLTYQNHNRDKRALYYAVSPPVTAKFTAADCVPRRRQRHSKKILQRSEENNALIFHIFVIDTPSFRHVQIKKRHISFSPAPVVTDNARRSCPQTGVTLMLHLFAGPDFHTGLMLILALLFVLFYEAINGFHDTANAVATVIYTRAMRSQLAVVMAGLFNFLGVMLGGLSVAYAIVHLLPTDLLLNVSSAHGLAMVFSMLLAAIIWNLGTGISVCRPPVPIR